MNINMDVIREVMAVAKRLDEKTLVNTFEGNISAKVDGKIYITPTTKNKGLLTEDMIAVMDENGNQIHGNCKPTSELPMHTETYTIRDDIGGVVHCHPPYLTAYALANKDVETRAYPEMMVTSASSSAPLMAVPAQIRFWRARFRFCKTRETLFCWATTACWW